MAIINVILFSVLSYFLYPLTQWIPLSLGLIIYTLGFQKAAWTYWLSTQVVVLGTILLGHFMKNRPSEFIFIFFMLLVYYLLLILITKLRPRIAGSIYLIFGALLLILYYHPEGLGAYRNFLTIPLFLWATNFFAILIDLRQSGSWNTNLLKWYNPPWSIFGFLPLGSRYLEEKRAKNMKDLLRWQGEGIKLVALCSVLHLLQNFFYSWAIKNGAQIDVTAMATGGANITLWDWTLSHYSQYFGERVSLWLITYTGAIMSVIKIIFLFGFSVSVARMFGYAFIMFPYPLSAMASFSKFYGNLLHYYNKILVMTFYPIFFRKFRRLGTKYNAHASLFFTVFIGGTLAHFVFHLRRIDLFDDFGTLILRSLDFSKYSLALAAVVIFVRLAPEFDAKKHNTALNTFMILVTFTIYSLILTANVAFFRKGQSWIEYFDYLKSLFLF